MASSLLWPGGLRGGKEGWSGCGAAVFFLRTMVAEERKGRVKHGRSVGGLHNLLRAKV